ncbi:hypothetical protein F8388_025565 [Cannabis sativa]|uniref:Uncharacterized protein n=1 Tax=Cannabis sativa TaxID=3483 RepID=A0A7J6G117_CANSA|nr:hypothetical protein F8388_025565 [Cannabis sativa]
MEFKSRGSSSDEVVSLSLPLLIGDDKEDQKQKKVKEYGSPQTTTTTTTPSRSSFHTHTHTHTPNNALSAAISANDEHRLPKLGASIVGGLIVTVMIYSVGHISGAHMNPAVTLAFATFRHFPWKQVPFYAVAQVTGGILGAITLREVLNPIQQLGTTTPSGTDAQALIMEIVVTFVMMFVTSAVATDTKAVGELAGIAVGSSVCIASMFAGPISGGSMNPARTLGPAIASGQYKGIWVYIVGPVIGTLLGSGAYRIIRVSDNKAVHAISPSYSFKLPTKMTDATVV